MTMMIRCLAAEHKAVTFMAVKPGIVDTQMVQSLLAHADTLDAANVEFMRKTPKLDAKVPAVVLVDLVLTAPASYSGQFFSYNQLPK
jgi:NAD(P)-dependent dehydrogenase (short-subunit alcohol dehydrogenase family)